MVHVRSAVPWPLRFLSMVVPVAALASMAIGCSASSDSDPFGKGGGGGTKPDAAAGGAAGTGGGASGASGTGGAAGWLGTGGTGGSVQDAGPSDVSQPQDGAPEAGDAADDVCFLKSCTADGRQVLDCNGQVEQTCGDTEICQAGSCVDACHYVENDKSSVGCNYVAIDMDEHHGGSCFVAMVPASSAGGRTWTVQGSISTRVRT